MRELQEAREWDTPSMVQHYPYVSDDRIREAMERTAQKIPKVDLSPNLSLADNREGQITG
jgi:hypothetical protein